MAVTTCVGAAWAGCERRCGPGVRGALLRVEQMNEADDLAWRRHEGRDYNANTRALRRRVRSSAALARPVSVRCGPRATRRRWFVVAAQLARSGWPGACALLGKQAKRLAPMRNTRRAVGRGNVETAKRRG